MESIEYKLGDQVIFTGKLKMLDEGAVGLLDKILNDCCVIIYPQNSAYEYHSNGGWSPIKNAPNKVYAHSCKLSEIKKTSE